MDLPLISVVIPVLNEENFIEQCLETVFNQTYPEDKMDIIIVDGRSQDRTVEIVNRISKQHPCVRLLDNPHCLQSYAFNIGVKISTTPFVTRLDAHALYDRGYIEKSIKRLLENTNRGNVGGKCIIRSQDHSLVAQANALLNQSRFGIGGAAFRVSSLASIVDTVPFGTFPRKVLEKVGEMNTSKILARGEDNEYNSRIRKAGYDIYFDPEIQCEYFARKSIHSSIRQMYYNGISIGVLILYDRKAVGLRHLVPFVFVMSLIILFVAGFFCSFFHKLLLVEAIVYMLANLISSLAISFRHGFKQMLVLPILFFMIHISYGAGTFMGMIRYIFNSKSINE